MMQIFKLISAATLGTSLIIGAAAQAGAAPKADIHTIRNDRGGYVIEYALRMKKLQRSGGYVRFAGRCDSACTLFLAMPKSKSCITSGASFGFHMPFGSSSGGNAVAAKFMMKTYPAWVRSWIRKNGGLTTSIRTMRYQDAARFIPTCAERSPERGIAAFISSHGRTR